VITQFNHSHQIGKDLTRCLNVWDSTAQGRPTTDYGRQLISALLRLIESDHLSSIPPECLYPISEALHVPGSNAKVTHDGYDWWGLVHEDLGKAGKKVFIKDGRTHDATSKSSLWPSLMNSRKHMLGPSDSFCGCIDMPSTPNGIGSVALKIPNDLADILGPFSSCDAKRQSKTTSTISCGSSITPTGWYSLPHYDYDGGSSILVHLLGQKIWILFPRTEHNTQIMDSSIEHTFGFDDVDLVAVLDRLEGVQYHIAREPAAFILSPFEYHACLCLETTLHIGGPLWLKRDVSSTCRELNAILDRWEDGLRKDSEMSDAVRVRMIETVSAMAAVTEKDTKHGRMVKKLEKRVNML
jgi:hypothetical protein